MYEVILNVIGAPVGADVAIVNACIVMVVVLTVVFIDLIYRVFRHFWR